MYQKVFKLSSGNRLYFSCNPPFGYWTMNYSRGALPAQLNGQYTSFTRAYKEIESYLGGKGITIGEEETWPEKQAT